MTIQWLVYIEMPKCLCIKVEDNGVRSVLSGLASDHRRQAIVIAAARLHLLGSKHHVMTHITEEELLDEQHEHRGNSVVIRIEGPLQDV